MTSREVNELISKAEKYLELANIAFEKAFYPETCFLSSITSELALKGLSLALVGSYPTTHDLRQILSFLRERGVAEVEEFVKKNREKLTRLTSEYFISRYNLGISYSKEDAEDCFVTAKEVIQFVRRLLHKQS